LFFILSGFVISYVYILKATWTRKFFYKFYSARFARIYPLYIATLLLAGLIIVYAASYLNLGIPGNINIVSFVRQLFLTNALPLISVAGIWVFTSWSVSIEWYLYMLVFPVLMSLRKYRPRLSSPFIMILLIVGLVAYLTLMPGELRVTRSWPAWIRGTVGFTLGWMVHEHYLNRSKLALWCAKYCDVMLVLSAVIILVMPFFTNNQPFVVLILFPFLILGLSFGGSYADKMLSSKVMTYLGDISYSVYLIHPLVLLIVGIYFKDKELTSTDVSISILYSVIILGASVGLSALSYRFLECPARDWLKNVLTPSKEVVPRA